MMAKIKRRPQPFNSSPAQADLPRNAVVLPDRLRGCRLMQWPQGGGAGCQTLHSRIDIRCCSTL